MSNEITFEIRGLEELKDKCQKLLSVYPDETNAEMEKCSVDFQKDTNKKFPNNGKTGGKYAVSKKWKKIRQTTLLGYTVMLELQNQAPHFHLVENGHDLYMSKEMYAAYMEGRLGHIKRGKSSGKKGGTWNTVYVRFIPGKHYCEQTRNEWNNGEFDKRVQKHIKKLLKKCDLT